MPKWTPLFSCLVESSVWLEADHVRLVWITLLAKRDFDDVVRGSAFNISRWANKTEQETLDALKVLSSPDTKRVEPQPFDGRRIEKIDGGWRILNAAKYRAMTQQNSRAEYQRLKQKEYRKRRKLAQLEGAQQAIRDGFNDELHETAPPYQSNVVPQPSVQTFTAPYTPP